MGYNVSSLLTGSFKPLLENLDGRIIEACYDPGYVPDHRWKFMRFRDDKPYANHASTVDRIVVSIRDSVEKDQVALAINSRSCKRHIPYAPTGRSAIKLIDLNACIVRLNCFSPSFTCPVSFNKMSFAAAAEHRAELVANARAIVAPGKGILAADESVGTIGKRFDGIKVENNEENRRAYRELLFTAGSELKNYIGGVITFEETLFHKTCDGKLLADVLREQGIIVGIKVDKVTIITNY